MNDDIVIYFNLKLMLLARDFCLIQIFHENFDNFLESDTIAFWFIRKGWKQSKSAKDIVINSKWLLIH